MGVGSGARGGSEEVKEVTERNLGEWTAHSLPTWKGGPTWCCAPCWAPEIHGRRDRQGLCLHGAYCQCGGREGLVRHAGPRGAGIGQAVFSRDDRSNISYATWSPSDLTWPLSH